LTRNAWCILDRPPPPRWYVKQNTATDRVANSCHRNNTSLGHVVVYCGILQAAACWSKNDATCHTTLQQQYTVSTCKQNIRTHYEFFVYLHSFPFLFSCYLLCHRVRCRPISIVSVVIGITPHLQVMKWRLWLLTASSQASVTFIYSIHQQVSALHYMLLNKWQIHITWTVQKVTFRIHITHFTVVCRVYAHGCIYIVLCVDQSPSFCIFYSICMLCVTQFHILSIATFVDWLV